MKTTARCPKCQHPKVWRIEKIGVKDPSVRDGSNIPLQAVDRGRMGGEDGPAAYDTGHVDAYVCAACGFCELHWTGLERLEANPQFGVHLLEATDTPYR
jgi:hypothetical protein